MAKKKRRRAATPQRSHGVSTVEPRRPRSTPPRDVFHEDSVGREFFPVADLFQPHVGLAQARAAVTVQQEVLAALLADPRVLALFGRWHEQLAAAPQRLNTDGVLSLVRDELGLPWPWCAVGLLEAFHRTSLGAEALSREEETEVAVHAPPLAAWFPPPLDGESLDENEARWDALNAEMKARFAEARHAAPSADRFRARPPEQLRLYARWFYAHRVAQPRCSINALAKDARQDRKSVREGIRTAEQLLGLGAYRFPLGE